MPLSAVYTVSKVNDYLKSLLSDDTFLADVWLSGEISNFKQAVSGHCYFTLKDAGGCIRAVMWRTHAAGTELPHDGDAVVAHGYVSIYEQQGNYQLYVDKLQQGGIGWLWQEYQRLKEQLEDEGLFAAEHKRPLPALPARLGVVTSAGAAALRDVLRTLAMRCPMVDVLFASTPVQGDEAPRGIVAALAALNCWSESQEPLDAIILARGGGSLEELKAFNDERVARAIAASAVPVISGVGHETDFTIADFVADRRASTPTGAALAAVPDARDLAARVSDLRAHAEAEITRELDSARTDLEHLRGKLMRLTPSARLASDRQRIDDLGRRADRAIGHRLQTLRGLLRGQQLLLTGLDPSAVLARGYALVSTSRGALVASQEQVRPGDLIHIRVANGSFDADVRG